MKVQILSYLPARHPWRDNIHWFDTLESTNTLAKRMALEGAPHGTVLIADRQTAGRGRMGRSFHSPKGMGIYMSVILRYPVPAHRLMHLTCAAAVAVCRAVESACGFCPEIKWINDLICQQRKLAGILTELVFSGEETCAVVGIGINCCQQPEDFDPEIRDLAVSLASASGKRIDRAKIAAAMVEALTEMDATLLTEEASTMTFYRDHCVTLGKDICLIRAGQIRYGYAEALNPDGSLLVRFPDGHREAVNSGEASVRGMYGYL